MEKITYSMTDKQKEFLVSFYERVIKYLIMDLSPLKSSIGCLEKSDSKMAELAMMEIKIDGEYFFEYIRHNEELLFSHEDLLNKLIEIIDNTIQDNWIGLLLQHFSKKIKESYGSNLVEKFNDFASYRDISNFKNTIEFLKKDILDFTSYDTKEFRLAFNDLGFDDLDDDLSKENTILRQYFDYVFIPAVEKSKKL